MTLAGLGGHARSGKGHFSDLKEGVIDTGLCTRCGGCAAVCPVNAISFRAHGMELTGGCISCGACSRICPGKEVDLAAHEERIFGRSRKKDRGARLGIYLERKHLDAKDRDIYRAGYYGGRVTAILISALEAGMIDAALLTDWSGTADLSIGSARLARSKEEILHLSSTKYVFSPVLTLLREVVDDRSIQNVALVGLPCHLHALRKMETDPAGSRLVRKVKYAIGLNCGNAIVTEEEWGRTIERLTGIDPKDISSFSARKVKGSTLRFKIGLKEKSEEVRDIPIYRYMATLTFAKKWKRCNLCPDYSGELSDVTFGAPVIRTEKGKELVDKAIARGYLTRGSRNKALNQDFMDLFVAFRKKSLSGARARRRRRKGAPIPFYGRQ